MWDLLVVFGHCKKLTINFCRSVVIVFDEAKITFRKFQNKWMKRERNSDSCRLIECQTFLLNNKRLFLWPCMRTRSRTFNHTFRTSTRKSKEKTESMTKIEWNYYTHEKWDDFILLFLASLQEFSFDKKNFIFVSNVQTRNQILQMQTKKKLVHFPDDWNEKRCQETTMNTRIVYKLIEFCTFSRCNSQWFGHCNDIFFVLVLILLSFGKSILFFLSLSHLVCTLRMIFRIFIWTKFSSVIYGLLEILFNRFN